ncbi:hypothetical protein Tco_0514019 [Tanacetum coccineum]
MSASLGAISQIFQVVIEKELSLSSDMTWWTTKRQRGRIGLSLLLALPFINGLHISPVIFYVTESLPELDSSRVAGMSSSKIDFNHAGLGLTCEKCAKPVSSKSDILADFRIGAGGYDEPEAPVLCRRLLLRSELGGGGRGS